MFKDNGLLTEKGKEVLAPVQKALDAVLQHDDISRMSDIELQVIGAALAKMVGDTISWKRQAKRDMTNKLFAMTDEQFDAYMRDKYNGDWLLVSLTEEELARCPQPSAEERKASLKEAIKDRDAASTWKIPGIRA